MLIATLIKRYKRFLMDVWLNGQIETVYVPNTGSLLGLLNEGARVLLSQNPSQNKLKYTAQAIEFGKNWVGINTQRPNKLIKEAILNKHPLLSEFSDFNIKPEQKYGVNNRSKIDLLLNDNIYIEIKNVTLMRNNIAYFPDAVTLRGQKHLEDLIHVKSLGHEAYLFFLVQRLDCESFSIAHDIDKAYGKKFEEAINMGVKVKVFTAKINEEGISLFSNL